MRRYVDSFRLRLTFFDNPPEREWEGKRVRVIRTEDFGKLKLVETTEVEREKRKRAFIVRPTASTDYLDKATAKGEQEGIPVFLGTV